MTQLSPKQARKLQQHSQGFTPKPAQSATPPAKKVIAQHAIARTQADVSEMQQVGELRTKVVLEAFDRAMAQSDQDIITGLQQRLGETAQHFFDGDLATQMQGLLDGCIPVPALAAGK
ncbi:MAG: hypothetical protein HC805_00955 [Alkalinema sp. RL_2_19]|nr:hypothetical protein [Alkalinema sp. RL_2_19]